MVDRSEMQAKLIRNMTKATETGDETRRARIKKANRERPEEIEAKLQEFVERLPFLVADARSKGRMSVNVTTWLPTDHDADIKECAGLKLVPLLPTCTVQIEAVDDPLGSDWARSKLVIDINRF